MKEKLTRDQLDNLDQETLVELYMTLQEQVSKQTVLLEKLTEHVERTKKMQGETGRNRKPNK